MPGHRIRSDNVANRQRWIEISLRTGPDLDPEWTLTLSRRTGRYASANEIKENIVWWRHTGKVEEEQEIKQWLTSNGVADLEQPLLSVIRDFNNDL